MANLPLTAASVSRFPADLGGRMLLVAGAQTAGFSHIHIHIPPPDSDSEMMAKLEGDRKGTDSDSDSGWMRGAWRRHDSW